MDFVRFAFFSLLASLLLSSTFSLRWFHWLTDSYDLRWCEFVAMPAPESTGKDWKTAIGLTLLFGGWYLANIYFNM